MTSNGRAAPAAAHGVVSEIEVSPRMLEVFQRTIVESPVARETLLGFIEGRGFPPNAQITLHLRGTIRVAVPTQEAVLDG